MCGCAALRAAEETEAAQLLVEHWAACVFCNKFFRLFKAAAVDPVSRQEFIRTLKAVVKLASDVKQENIANSNLWKTIIAAKRVCWGLLGMCNPTFGNGSLADVRYVAPSSKHMGKNYLSLVDDLPKLGRALLSITSKDENDFWGKSRDEFEYYIGPMLMLEEEYLGLAREVDQMVAHLDAESALQLQLVFVQLFKNIFSRIESFITANEEGVAVRPGGYNEIRDKCSELCRSVFSNAVALGASHSGAVECVGIIKNFLPVIPNCTSLQTAVTDTSLEWSGTALSRSFLELMGPVLRAGQIQDRREISSMAELILKVVEDKEMKGQV